MMMGNTNMPVIAGLAVGIAFVILFVLMLKPVDAMTDDELRMLVSNQYPQFQALKERYPNSTVERIERYPWATYVHYEATSEPIDESIVSFARVLAITLEIRPLSARAVYVSCGSGVSESLPATVQAIKTTGCLETASNVGVFEPDTSGDELGGGNFAPDNTNKIDLRIAGLKDAYRSGEPIVFSVSAKGISDNACNVGSPGVSIHGDGNDKRINWPISFGFSTALMCGGSEPLDKEWAFGDKPENEILLDTPGQYTLVASFEDISIEKKFAITG